jgi:hypothetical protein
LQTIDRTSEAGGRPRASECPCCYGVALLKFCAFEMGPLLSGGECLLGPPQRAAPEANGTPRGPRSLSCHRQSDEDGRAVRRLGLQSLSPPEVGQMEYLRGGITALTHKTPSQSDSGQSGDYLGRLVQRARAAWAAISRRRTAVRLRARVWPPIRPSSWMILSTRGSSLRLERPFGMGIG